MPIYESDRRVSTQATKLTPYTFRRISGTMVSVIGSHTTINMWSKVDTDLTFPFGSLVKMLLRHFDKPQHNNDVFVVGSNQFVDSDKVAVHYPGKSLIVYQVDQLLDGARTWIPVESIVKHIRTFERIWEIDYDNAEYLKQQGIAVEAVVPVRYTPELIDVPDHPKDIDVLFYGSLNTQRMMTLARLQASLVKRASLIWGFSLGQNALLDLIGRSKIILNINSTTPANRQEQARIFHAIINKKCVIAQRCPRNYFPGMIIEADDVGKAIIECLQTESWKTVGQIGHDLFFDVAKRQAWL